MPTRQCKICRKNVSVNFKDMKLPVFYCKECLPLVEGKEDKPEPPPEPPKPQ